MCSKEEIQDDNPISQDYESCHTGECINCGDITNNLDSFCCRFCEEEYLFYMNKE